MTTSSSSTCSLPGPDWATGGAVDEDGMGVPSSASLSSSMSKTSFAFSFPFADAAGESLWLSGTRCVMTPNSSTSRSTWCSSCSVKGSICSRTSPSVLAGSLCLRENHQRRFFPLSVCSGWVGRVREESGRDLKDGFGRDEIKRRGRERRGVRVSFERPGAGADASVGIGAGAGRRERDWPMVA